MSDTPNSEGAATPDPIADDIAARNPATDDVVAGEQVLADDPSEPEPRVAPEPDELTSAENARHADDSGRSSDQS